ncbi:MAG: reverse gyrase [Aquificaceae bacterium]
MIESLFLELCPNCKGSIDAKRLDRGLPCERCMPSEDSPVCEVLKEGELKRLCEIEDKVKKWGETFERYIGSRPWSLQSLWAKRAFLGNSFALLAPTGVGKTSFGLSFALYLAKGGRKSYLILPTKLLVNQISRKLKSMGVRERDLLIFDQESKKKKEEKKKRLKDGKFLILVSTSMFFYKNIEIMPKDISFVFVDDVDSFLKTAKNIDKVLYLLGFSEEDVNKAMKLIKLKESFKKSQQDWRDIEELSKKVGEISKKAKGVLVVSSATSNPRSSRIKLFRELLGFEVGTPTFYLRNVKDLYSTFQEGSLSSWVKRLGKGGLVFLSSDMKREKVYEVIKELEGKGIKAVSYEDLNEEKLRLYEKGKIDVFVGIASYKNPLARGLDLPHVVRYALFYGVPKMVISLEFEKNLSHILWALTSIRPHIAKKLSESIKKVDQWIKRFRSYQYLSEDYLKERPELESKIGELRKEIENFLTSQDVLEILKLSDEITLRYEGGEHYLVVSDATGYLQASGRTSRMYAGGITEGLCITLVDDQRAFKHLQRKVRWFSDEISFLPIDSISLDEVLRRIDQDRTKVRKFLKSDAPAQNQEVLRPVLIVVESPNKARTIAGFFGKAIRRKVENHEVLETSVEDRYLMITSSFGHVLDLAKDVGFHGVYVNSSIVPVYTVIEGKRNMVDSLRRLASEASEVLIATDPDTEGEKIGWDIMELLKPYARNIRRMEFHEVTKKAIIKALKEPRDFNINLVRSQIVRRVSDRWIGFEFSRTLQQAFSKNWLSAGRVQTPVLGWIVEREKDYRKKIYKVLVSIEESDKNLKFGVDFENRKDAKEFYEKLSTVEVKAVNLREEIRNPPPPYSTDTLLKDANSKYRFSVPKTMQLAQTLFELGFITYHRTDSVRVSDYGINLAREYIREELGEEYLTPRTWQEGGTHECIRPTKVMEAEELSSIMLSGQLEGINKEHVMLYDLVFRRFMASQTRPARLRVVDVLIKALDREIKLTLSTHVLEDGWNKLLYLETHPLVEGTLKVEKKLKEYPKAFLYTQGDIIHEMKAKGIGRPSTYASTIEKLLDRGYVIEVKGFLIPTKLGKETYRYMSSKEEMKPFISEEFTRRLEDLMDMVEEGSVDHENILKDLYDSIMSLEYAK